MIPNFGIIITLFWSVFARTEDLSISEIMPVNRSTLTDEDGDFSDWIEIYNPTDKDVNLLNFGLSDESENPFKWRFPEHVLGPGERTLVFASGKDRRSTRLRSKTIESGLPLTIPGLSLWLDASDESSLVMDNTGAVRRWTSNGTAAKTRPSQAPTDQPRLRGRSKVLAGFLRQKIAAN